VREFFLLLTPPSKSDISVNSVPLRPYLDFFDIAEVFMLQLKKLHCPMNLRTC